MSSNGPGKTWGWEGMFADVISIKISGSNTYIFIIFTGKLLVQPMSIRLKERVCIGKLFSLFLNHNICCGNSKETVLLSTQNTFKLMGKK